jgi:hypothetical protein
MKKLIRNQSLAKIQVEVTNKAASGDGKWKPNGQLPYSNADLIDRDFSYGSSFATLELNRWILDGSQLIAGDEVNNAKKRYKEYSDNKLNRFNKFNKYNKLNRFNKNINNDVNNYLNNLSSIQGYISSSITDTEGNFKIEPVLIREFGSPYTIPGISILFDTRTGIIPRSIAVLCYLEGKLVSTLVKNNIDEEQIAINQKITADRIEIHFVSEDSSLSYSLANSTDSFASSEFISVPPFTRARIERVWFGVAKNYGNDEIQEVNVINDIDPISRRLPTQDLKFSVIDFERLYDFDNPEGIYSYLDVKSKVSLRWGYRLDDNSVFWLAPDKYLLDSKPKSENGIAKFKCTKLLAQMTETFYEGTFDETVKLSDIAKDIVFDAGLNLNENDIVFRIPETYSSSAIPIESHANCLQMIANACCCSIFCDSQNRINIIPFDTENLPSLSDFSLDYDTIIEKTQKQRKVPLLESISVNLYSNVIGNQTTTDKTVIFNQTVNQKTPEDNKFLLIFGNPAKNINITITGGSLNQDETKIYAQSAVAVLDETAGTKTITVVGDLVSYSFISDERVVAEERVEEEKLEEEEGEKETISNLLITSETQKENILNWYVNYLSLRDTYDTEYRGNPEIEPGDIILTRSFFTPNIKSLVLRNEIKFNGALSGKILTKKIEILELEDEDWQSNEVSSNEVYV